MAMGWDGMGWYGLRWIVDELIVLNTIPGILWQCHSS